MIRSRPCVCRSPRAAKPLLANALFLAIIGIGCAGRAHATGYAGPSEYLAPGEGNVDGSPEFCWELEVKRLAKEFHPPEKALDASMMKKDADAKDRKEDADTKGRAAASKEGRTPDDDDSEFSDYEKGADPYNSGVNILDDLQVALNQAGEPYAQSPPVSKSDEAKRRVEAAGDFEEARKTWEALLKRPPAERHYRSVWAAYMLGKVALRRGDPEAVKWFQMTRELAKQGFADSLGLAADSYGWEARSEWKQGHPETAAPLYLTQLALGDESAIVSLKALIPDRDPVDGMENYGPDYDEMRKWSDEQKHAQEQKTLAALRAAAKDPLLRRLVTAHILATCTGKDLYSGEISAATKRSRRWLSVIDEAKPGSVDDAEYLGWVAYSDADYKAAANWLALAKNDTPAACWLRAKLQGRAGQLDKAAANMQKAWLSIHDTTGYTGWASGTSGEEGSIYVYLDGEEGERWTFPQSASGDLAQLHLAHKDFVQAMDAFLKGGLWQDAAYVAERVLTADELKAYVDQNAQQPFVNGKPLDMSEKGGSGSLKYLLGRRLVREDRYDEAARYFPAPWDKVLGKYTQALKTGADETAPKIDRAGAWFTAAWLARHDGMELMGTEVAPDGFESSGDFPNADVAKERRSGVYDVAFKPSVQELHRLAANQIHPDTRYHYRLIAGALAMRAASLLNDNTEELADVVNTAGLWVKDRDEKTGDRYFAALKKRCATTKIGAAAIAKHWFVDQPGPWTQEQQTAHAAMYKELGIQDPER